MSKVDTEEYKVEFKRLALSLTQTPYAVSGVKAALEAALFVALTPVSQEVSERNTVEFNK